MRTRTALGRFLLLATVALTALAAAPGTPSAAPAPEGAITSGWSVLKEGQGDGAIEMDAKHPTNPSPHLLKLSMTNYAEPGKGRFGAKNSMPISVKDGQWYDITFNGISEGIGVGLVFSLETDDGKVLARTTLPEIGRGARGRGGRGANNAPPASAPAVTWRPYLVSLHARNSAENAHLVVTPIETVPVWLDNLRFVERKPAQ
jgi:hypothetical protein